MIITQSRQEGRAEESVRMQQKEDQIQFLRSILNKIKQDYFQFLSSLKFENLSQKRKYKATKKSLEKRDERLHELIDKDFSFEAQMAVENTGCVHFIKLVEHIAQLEKFNNKLSLRILQKTQFKTTLGAVQETNRSLKEFTEQLQIDYEGHRRKDN